MAKVNRYSKEFKAEAVKLVTEQGYSYFKAGREQGVSTATIRDWVLKLHGSPVKPHVFGIILAVEEMANAQ